jgi:deoxyribodipyrimidine photolyase-related protein
VEAADTEHFLTTRTELTDRLGTHKAWVMENFYRQMRLAHRVLLTPDAKPEGGKWNYDQQNRQKLPTQMQLPPVYAPTTDLRPIAELVAQAGVATLGAIRAEAFAWPVTRAQALAMLEDFCQHRLAQFGQYQDALDPRCWAMFHSRLSFALNIKLLHPMEVIRRVEACYDPQQPDPQLLAQVEGFIRQILGWREFMRGIYWAKMPGYAHENFFHHTRPLPSWFWTGQTKMRCLQHAIGQSLEHAYAHHIQRLMVTGNFALLAGCDPAEVDAWYLGIYIDAFEWVEITNTRGMSQFADGGVVGTKPYVSSANYLHKMGNYCNGCAYDPKLKTGPRACPFNSLYWEFLHRHADLLDHNPRMTMVYKVWEKMPAQDQQAILQQARHVLANIETL